MATVSPTQHLPYKSVAVCLLFCTFLGPVGLLYASFWGAIIMIPIAIVMLSNKFFFLSTFTWIICCAWGVRAVESYNERIYIGSQRKHYERE